MGIDEILGGMTREEFAESRLLFPSQYAESLSEEDFYQADIDYRVAALNSIYGAPAFWPGGEIEALSGFEFGEHGFRPLPDRDMEFEDQKGAIVLIRDRFTSYGEADQRVWTASSIAKVSELEDGEAIQGRSRLDERTFRSRAIAELHCPRMPEDSLQMILSDKTLPGLLRFGAAGFSPRLSMESCGDLRKVIAHGKLSRLFGTLMKRPTVSVKLYLGDGAQWKQDAEIYMDAGRAQEVLSGLENLASHGIKISSDRPLSPKQILNLSAAVDHGLCEMKADLTYDLLSPAEKNRIPIAKSREVENEYNCDRDYRDAITLVTTHLEDSYTTESILYYLPDTDRFLLEREYSSEHVVHSDVEWVNQAPGIDADVEYEGGSCERWLNSDGSDSRIVTDKEAREFLNSEGSFLIGQSPERDEAIARLRCETHNADRRLGRDRAGAITAAESGMKAALNDAHRVPAPVEIAACAIAAAARHTDDRCRQHHANAIR